MLRELGSDLLELRVRPPVLVRVLFGAACVGLVLLLWWLLTTGAEPESRVISPVILPSPAEVFGSFGSLFATPVISQPNVAILGVGAIVKEPVVTTDDAIAIRSTCFMALTFDHRLIDGAVADQFTARVKDILENWNEKVL